MLAPILNRILFGGKGLLHGSSSVLFSAALTHSLTPEKGELFSFSRDSDSEATITGFEGSIVGVQANGARFYGARSVENICKHINNTAFFSVTQGLGASSVNNGETRNFSGLLTGTLAYQTSAAQLLNVDEESQSTIKIRLNAPIPNDATFSLYNGGGGALTNLFTGLTQPALGVWTEFSGGNQVENNTSNGTAGFGVLHGGTNGNIDFDVKEIQYETVTHRADKSPSEYVSVGVGTESEILSDPNMMLFTDTFPYFGEVWDYSAATIDSTGFYGKAVEGNGFEVASKNVALIMSYDNYISARLLTAASDKIRVSAIYEVSVTVDIANLGHVDFTKAKIHVLTDFNESVAGTAVFDLKDLADGIHTLNATVVAQPQIDEVQFWVRFELDRDFTTTIGSIHLTNVSLKEINHGSNADGLKYFDTDRDGNPIPATDLKGVLIEKDSTNLIYDSVDMSSGSYTTTNSSFVASSNSIKGLPSFNCVSDGVAGVTSISYPAGSDTSALVSGQILASNTGIYKYLWLRVSDIDGSSVVQFYDLSTGLLGALEEAVAPTTFVSAQIEPVPGGYHCILQSTSGDIGATKIHYGFSDTDGDRSVSPSNNDVLGSVCAPQFENGAPTSYIPTNGGTANRGLEELQYVFPEKLEPAGVSYSVSCEIYLPVDGVDLESPAGILDFGTSVDALAIRINNTGTVAAKGKSSAESKNVVHDEVLLKGRHRIATSYDANTKVTSLCVDGLTVLEAESFFIEQEFGTGSKHFFIGSEIAGANIANFPIKHIKIDNKTLTDAELIAASSLAINFVTESGDTIITESGDEWILE